MAWLGTHSRFFAFALIGVIAFSAAADESDPETQTVTFLFENDLFGDTDQQYTNGLRLSWLSPDLAKLSELDRIPEWAVSTVERLPMFGYARHSDRQFNVGMALGQLIFTPDDTSTRALVTDDRPYAGWLFGSLSFISKNAAIADTLEIQLGMIGPASLAEEAQKLVHDIRDLPEPRGWDNQLDNEPGLLLFYERKWRRTYRFDNSRFGVDVFPQGGVALGNVMTFINVGAEVRAGFNLPSDFGTTLIRPGGDANAPLTTGAPHQGVGIYAFTGMSGKLSIRDIFLDGNTFGSSHDVKKKYVVGDWIIGASLVWKQAKLSYAKVFRTREFDGQNSRHSFGSITFSFSF
ncbi:MAG: lipid A deacylase LpxR family protein [Pseudomonadota bacterium]